MRLVWLSTAPFGKPVVPEVYRISACESGVISSGVTISLPRHAVFRGPGDRVSCRTQLAEWDLQRRPLQRRHCLGHVHADHGLQRAIVAYLLECVSDFVPHDCDARSVVFELWAQLVGGIEGVVFHHDTADEVDGVVRRDMLRAVRQHDGHPITWSHAERFEPGRCAAHVAVKLPIRLRAAEKPGRRFVGVACEVVLVELRQRHHAVLEGVCGPLRVVAQPGLFGWGAGLVGRRLVGHGLYPTLPYGCVRSLSKLSRTSRRRIFPV